MSSFTGWRKSTYSFSNGNCLEWRTSTYSGGNGACVQVRDEPRIQVRDSRDPDGPVLEFSESTWGAFVADLKQPQGLISSLRS